MTTLKKLNTLVMSVFSEVENAEESWMAEDVQKELKAICGIVKRVAEGRRNRDPNAPKRGKSAYLYFCSEHRDAVQAALDASLPEGEKAKATEVTKELGARWNALKDSKKASDKKELERFTRLSAADKVRYEEAKSQYTPPEVDESEKPRRRGKRSPRKGPKRAKPAYLFFCDDMRSQVKESNPDFSATEVTSELGRLWNELKDDSSRADELARYTQMAQEEKERYEREKAELGDVSNAKPARKAAATTGARQPAKRSQVAAVKAPVNARTTQKPRPKAAAPPPPQEEEELVEQHEQPPVSRQPAKSQLKKTTNSSTNSQAKSAVRSEPAQAKKTVSRQQRPNGYNSFCSAKREEFARQFPNTAPSEITKKLSNAWKALSRDEQEEWKVVSSPAE